MSCTLHMYVQLCSFKQKNRKVHRVSRLTLGGSDDSLTRGEVRSIQVNTQKGVL